MEDLKKKRSMVKSQFTRAEKSLSRLLEGEDTIEEQISKRFNDLSQKWQEVQDAHDLYITEVSAENVEEENVWIEEIEVRFEKIERDTMIYFRKIGQQQQPLIATMPRYEPITKIDGSDGATSGQYSNKSGTPLAQASNVAEAPSLLEQTAASSSATIDQSLVEDSTQQISTPSSASATQLVENETASSVVAMDRPLLGGVLQLEKLKLEKYDGDIRKYPAFKARFNSYIEPMCPKSQTAFLLRSHLGTVVREEVENVEDDVSLLWQRLDSKYGNARKYIDVVLSDLSKVSKGDGMAALHMINTVEKAYRDLVRIGAEMEMSNSYMISMIERKLPEQMRIEWVKSIAEKGETDSQDVFRLLMEFLAKWRKIIEYDAAAIRKTSDKKMVGHANHVSDTRQKSTKSEVCWVHEGGNHPVWKCKLFQMMSIKEKLDMVKQKQACHACFETSCPGTKNPEECGKKFKCPMKGCGKPHNILIHQQ